MAYVSVIHVDTILVQVQQCYELLNLKCMYTTKNKKKGKDAKEKLHKQSLAKNIELRLLLWFFFLFVKDVACYEMDGYGNFVLYFFFSFVLYLFSYFNNQWNPEIFIVVFIHLLFLNSIYINTWIVSEKSLEKCNQTAKRQTLFEFDSMETLSVSFTSKEKKNNQL